MAKYKRPKIGDRKLDKNGKELIRRQVYTREGDRWYGLVRGSRPVCEWVPVRTPPAWRQADDTTR